MLTVLVERDDLHRDMAGERIELELAQHRPSEHVRQEYVERDRGRLVLLSQFDSPGAEHRNENLEAFVAGKVHHDSRIMRVVLDDQQRVVPGAYLLTIVGNGVDRGMLHDGSVDGGPTHRRRRLAITLHHT